MLSEVQRAWAAGVFDGEGCVAILRESRSKCHFGVRYELQIQVKMAHEETVRRFQEYFGGGVFVVPPERNGYKMMWVWQNRGREKVWDFLLAVIPYSCTKQRELFLALDALQVWGPSRSGPLPKGHREEILAIRDAYYWALRQEKVA